MMGLLLPRKVAASWGGGAVAALALASFNAGFVTLSFAAANFALVTAASAADISAPTPYVKAPVAPQASWTGFYLGGSVGFRASQVDGDVSPGSISVANNFRATCSPSINCVDEQLAATSLRFSPYFGYEYQFASQWLAGIEADVGLGRNTASIAGMFAPNTGVTSFDGRDSFAVKTDWDASLRARIGFLVTPSFLVYGTGGAAWQRIEATSSCSTAFFTGVCGFENGFNGAGFGPSVITDASTKPGYTLGAGFETMLWPNWLVRGEYRFADFGTITDTDTRCIGPCSFGSLVVTDKLRLRTQTATFGVAYKFGLAGSDPSAAALGYAPPFAKAPAAASSYDWTGFYLGGGVGMRSSQVNGDVSPDSLTRFGNGVTDCSVFACSGEDLNGSELRGSLYLGYNYQFATRWLAGVEGDWGFGGKTTTLNNVFYPNSFISNRDGFDAFSIKTAWDASVRGRVGFLVTPSFLVYGTAGAAWQRLEAISSCSTFTGGADGDLCAGNGLALAPATIMDTATKLGWTIGAGIETMLWRNWIVRGEYRYADFGTITNTDTRTCPPSNCGPGPLSPLVVTDTLRLRTHTATLGLAYKFDWTTIR